MASSRRIRIPALDSAVLCALTLLIVSTAPARPAGAQQTFGAALSQTDRDALSRYYTVPINALTGVAATDSLFEDRTVITWPATSYPNVFWRVKRNGVLLTVLSSQDSSYADLTGVPGTVYNYCVSLWNATTKDSIDAGCDAGSRVLRKPAQPSASDGLFDDAVRVTWSDQSVVEAAYRVYRNGSLIATLPVNSEYYADTTAVKGTAYSYCVRTTDALGRQSEGVCDTGYRGYLKPPAGVTASDGQYPAYTLVAWTPPPGGAAGFRIYRQNALVATLGSGATSFNDSTGANGTIYSYCVASLNAQNQESVRICDDGGRGILAGPTNVSASDALYDDKVTVSWTDPGDTEDGFKVYRVLGPDSLLITTTPSNVTSYEDKSGQPGTTYNYCVVAFTSQNAVSSPGCDNGTRSVVVAPMSVQATDGALEDRVDISWQSSSTSVVLFNIYRDGVVIQTVSGNVHSASDYNVAPGAVHQYCVRAVTAMENESAAGCDSGFRTLKAPGQVKASDDTFESHVLLTWTDNSSFESGYRIERKLVAAVNFDSIGVRPANSTAYLDSTGAPGTGYVYRVRPFDAKGIGTGDTDNGSRSLQAPGSLAATDGSFENKILLTWTDNSGAETGYRIYRKIGNGAESLLAVLAKNAGAYRDSGSVVFGTTYTYRVVASDAYGTSTGATDDGYTAIRPPSDVNASDTYTDKVTLTWVDQSAIETGFVITRDGVRLAAVAANATSFTDVSAAVGTTSTYCVRDTTATTQSADVCDSGIRAGAGAALPTMSLTSFPAGSNLDIRFMSYAVSGDEAVYADFAASTVHFLRNSNGSWSEIQTLSGGSFGGAVDIDAEHAVVGNETANSLAGLATIYTRTSSGWGSPVTLNGSGAIQFGAAVAISGNRVLIDAFKGGAGTAGKVFVYRLDNGSWVQETSFDSPGGDSFGRDIDFDGDRAIISSITNSYIYKRTGTSWALEATFGFGYNVDISGPTAVVAGNGSVSVFELVGGTWTGTQVLPAGGVSRAAVDGGSILVASPSSGFSIWRKLQGAWQATTSITLSDPGPLLWAVNADMDAGSGILVPQFLTLPAATLSQKVYLFQLVAAPSNLVASDDQFPTRVQLNWTDNAANEDGFHVYRDGTLVATLDPNIRSYSDYDGDAGRTYEYSVAAFNSLGESARISDYGRRPADGALNGRVSSRAGAGVAGVEVCLDPAPASALLFDGASGNAVMTGVEDGAAALDALTIEFWIRTTSSAAAPVFSYVNDANNQAVVTLNAGKLKIQVNNASASTETGAINDGRWHHAAFTWTSLLQGLTNVTIYVDGVQQTISQRAFGQTIASGGSLTLGQFAGQLDEVRLWRTRRSLEQIAAYLKKPVDPSDPSLLVYLPLDDRTGPAAFDAAGAKQYAVLQAGAFWSADAAPVQVCGETDLQGNYSIQHIPYGQGMTFKVTPGLEGHDFEPAFKSITLNSGSPVQNEVAFNDISSYTLSGDVTFDATTCPAEGVDVLLDNVVVGATNAQGHFAVPAAFGSHTLELRKADRTFSPAARSLKVSADTGALDFTDMTVRTLSGRAGGGCNMPIGTLTFEIRTENGCFVRTATASNTYSQKLPPQKYLVRVTDVTSVPAGALSRDQILAYFDNLGFRPVDLSTADQALDLIYRAPITVAIEGLPAPSCATLTLPDNTQVPAVPVIAQGEKVPLTIKVFEDYGGGNLCPLDSGKVTIFDEIMDEQDTPVELEIRNGQVQYQTIGNTPNVFPGRIDSNGNNRSYQKPITAVAQVPGMPAVTATEWVIVSGDKPRTATFTSTTDGVPILILRDPPGDASSAFLEKGTRTCSKWGNFGLQSLSTGLITKVDAGLRFSKGTPFWSSETEFKFETENNFKVGIEVTEDRSVEICAETLEKFSTSEDDSWTGNDGDLFVGLGLNLIFAKADVIQIQGCQVKKSESIHMGGNGFSTSYVYTAQHIRDVLIPQLEDLARLARLNQPADAARYESDIRNWKSQLALNDSLKKVAKFKENRSFSAGANYELSSSTERTGGFEWKTKAYTSDELALGFVFNETGSGVSNKFAVNVEMAYERSGAQDTTTTRTVGYTLGDDDIYDYFSVDVLDDTTYATPVFKTRSGRSSCPWEPVTQPRDSVTVRIEPPFLDNVDPDGMAHFTLSLTNESPSQEYREYYIQPIQTTNPDGASIFLVGDTFLQLAVNLDPGQTHTWDMTVHRGANKYRYDKIGIMAIPTCQFDYWRKTGIVQLADTAYFSVHYQAPCSDITLFEPKSGWSYNRARSLAAPVNQIRLTLADFNLQISETDSLESIGAEYRPVGTDVWFPIHEVLKANLEQGKSKDIYWNVGNIPDGNYELRAFTRCKAGKTYSGVATGVIDRKPPMAFGAPQPADSLLSLGDEISITFDEPIQCTSVTSSTVQLDVLNPDHSIDSVGVETACDGRTIIITPVDPAFPVLEGKKLQARVSGITDLLGNPMAGPNNSPEVVWRTDVRRNVFTWKEISVSKEAPYRNPGSITATLVNGTGAPVNFTITNLPAWLTAQPSSGTLGSGETMPVQLVISPTIAIGANNAPLTYNAIINAGVTSPPITSPLAVKVTVICVKPDWAVNPADFEQSMSLVAKLTINNLNQTDPNDRIAAFVGNQLRGVASPVYQPTLNAWLVFMTIYSNRANGENVRFQAWDDSDCRLYTATSKTIRFEADKREGSTAVPDVLNATDLPAATQQLIPVNAGWTWISLNLLSPVDMTLNGVLADLNPSSGDIAKSQTSFSQFDPATGWVGTLSDFNNVSGYALKLSEAGTIVHEGSPVPVSTTDIPIMNGWNWVSYLPQVAQPTNTALQLLAPQNGDVIKSQTQFAQYVKSGSIAAWFGDMTTMYPGLGYRMFLSNASVIQNKFRYYAPAPAPVAALPPLSDGGAVAAGGSGGAKDGSIPGIDRLSAADGSTDGSVEVGAGAGGATAETGAAVRPASLVRPKSLGPGWQVDPGQYSMNMTVTGQLELDGVPLNSETDVVAAFVGDECRGLAQPQFVPGLNQYLVFLMVYGNDGENRPVTFRLFDTARNQVVEIANTIPYEADKVTGTVIAPYQLQVTGAPGGGGGVPIQFNLSQNYPNPPQGSTVIRYALPTPERVLLRVFDVAGREVVTLVDRAQPAGQYDVTFDVSGLANGLYFYKLQAGSFTGVQKMMVVN